MREAQTILGLIHERGRKGLLLERVYRLLFNRNLYLSAYGRIYRNAGAMTPGTTKETVDGMSLAKIDAIIEAHVTSSIDGRQSDGSTLRRNTQVNPVF